MLFKKQKKKTITTNVMVYKYGVYELDPVLFCSILHSLLNGFKDISITDPKIEAYLLERGFVEEIDGLFRLNDEYVEEVESIHYNIHKEVERYRISLIKKKNKKDKDENRQK